MQRRLVLLDLGEAADSSTSAKRPIGSAKMLSVRSLLTVETSPISTSPPSPQNACQLPGMSVTLSPGARCSTAPGAWVRSTPSVATVTSVVLSRLPSASEL
ncbi:MAG: hypothetical protein MUE90_15605 [Thermoanaerobaculales bacterium]|nr:hypothetical protein [Thermoanaerobaculales bacterium]